MLRVGQPERQATSTMDKTELRLDPLTRDWTVFNENRAFPPVVGSIVGEALAPSPFRAGLEVFASQTLHHAAGDFGWQVRVVPNRMPILGVEGDCTPQRDGIYEHLEGVGAHEIVIEDPGERRFEELPVSDIARVVRAWAARIGDLMRDPRLRSFTVMKSVGRAAGQMVAHSLSQIVAIAVVPPILRRKLRHAREHFSVNQRNLFSEIIEEERRNGRRVVHENAEFLVFCPYASQAPFELAVWPKRQRPDFHFITESETAHLAEALRLALRKLGRALDHPSYHLSLTTAPSCAAMHGPRDTLDEDFRWHISIIPRLRPVETLELATGCHVNGVWPETAADYLRSLANDL